MKKILSSILIFSLISGTIISCRKKDKGSPPALISAETMQIDYFKLTYGAFVNNFDVKGIDDSNWKAAAEIISPWRELTDVTLSIPVFAYKAAIGYRASHLSGSKWEWSYDVNVSGTTYNVRLTGETAGSQVKWEMYVASGSGGFSEFKWLDGTSNVNGNTGVWTFYESPASSTPLLQIDWTKSGASIEKIKYTYLKSGSNKDAYIEYGSASGGGYDSYYEVYYYNETISQFSSATIEWSRTSKTGRIKSDSYLDGNWQCWDTQQINATCN